MRPFRLTVPGNLLLAGEYAVLEEGGFGAALAVEPRLTVTVTPGSEWQITGHWGGGREDWTPEDPGTPFVGHLFHQAIQALEARGDERGRRWSRVPPARLEIDSSAFFDPQGRKLGFGSSAALAVGVTAALARLAGRENFEACHPIAVAAHRHAQGGAGSGYDVTVSWFGGFGLFVGGEVPRWEAADPGRLPALAVFPGPEVVRTPGAIQRYRQWKASDPQAARDFLDASNGAVRTLTAAPSPGAFVEAWAQAKNLGLSVGSTVGSSAALDPPGGLDPRVFVKALGAGNETGVAAFPAGLPAPLPTGIVALTTSMEGIRWE